jgi:tRNA (uracil-5-)-methyltransferase TRM9
MNSIESIYVKEIYEKIALHFSATRKGDKWCYVSDFLLTFSPNQMIADIGCGNGKYITVRNDIQYIAIDNCDQLLNCAREIHKDETHVIYQNGSIAEIPLETNCVDGFICIAVFHHLFEKNVRFHAVEEMIRILKSGGCGMMTVWSTNQNPKRFRKWKQMESDEHDYLVPWTYRQNFGMKGIDPNKDVIYYERYYHIFDKDEILSYFVPYLDQIHIIQCEELHENWVIIFQKK